MAISGRHLRLVQAIADRTHLVGGGVLDAPPRNGTIFVGDFPVIRPGTAKLHPQGHFLALRAQGATAPLGPRIDKLGSKCGRRSTTKPATALGGH